MLSEDDVGGRAMVTTDSRTANAHEYRIVSYRVI